MFFRISLAPFALIAVLSLCGCGSRSLEGPSAEAAQSASPVAQEAGHEDEDHAGHNHCDHAGHDHPTEGPHGGHLIELGNEEYHAELLHDEKTDTATIHLLDGAGKQPVAVAQGEIALQLFQDGQFVKYAFRAVPGPGDAAGTASRFEIVDAALCEALCREDQVRGRLQITIAGKQYTGDVEHSSHGEHDHEGHDHGGDDHEGHNH